MIRPVAALLAPLLATLALTVTPPAGAMPERGTEHSSELAPSRVPTASRGAARISESDSFEVEITRVRPAVLPSKGRITLSGTITNATDEALTGLNVHPLSSYAPLTTTTEIAAAAAADPEITFGGQRLLDPGVLDNSIERLDAGSTATWQVRIPVEELEISGGEGVYVFGVQVLSDDADGGRDDIADGRSRTFVPKVLAGHKPTRTSVVVPVRSPVKRAADGQIEELTTWHTSLDDGGRLDNVLTLLREAEIPVTALVDPAVLTAVRQVAAGNPARDITPTLPDGDAGAEDGADDETDATAEPDGSSTGQGTVSAQSERADNWLTEMLDVLRVREVLSLPYGDLDVAAASHHLPSLIETATNRSAEVMDAFDLAGDSAVVPPDGLLPSSALAALGDTTVLLSTGAVPADGERTAAPPASVQLNGVDVLLHDDVTSGADPADPVNPVSVRQRILAEAAVRALEDGNDPLVVSLPALIDPGTSAGAMLRGLDVPFVRGVPLSALDQPDAPDVTAAEPDLTYTDDQAREELSAALFSALEDAITSGAVLDDLLPLNDTIGTQVLTDLLPEVSVHNRAEQVSGLARVRSTGAWVTSKLGLVEISAPSFVILSSESGPFSLTVRNGLDQPVAFAIRAETAREVAITAPQTIELDAQASRNLTLNARAANLGVHQVDLIATTVDGAPLGASDEINIRSNAVSKVIWVVLGVGVGILFIAITIRLVRRIRRRRGSVA